MFLILQGYWNILVTGCNSLQCSGFSVTQSDCIPGPVLLKQGQCSNSKQPLPAAELGFTLPPAWPSHWEQCDCWTRAQVLPYTLGQKALPYSLYLPIYLYHSDFVFQPLPHKHKHTSNTWHKPCPSPLGSTRWVKGWIGLCRKEQKEGVSAEGRKRTGVWVVVGGELLLRRGMIFFCYMFWAFTLLGHQAAC